MLTAFRTSATQATRELRRWPRIRWLVAAVTVIAVLAGMVVASDFLQTPVGLTTGLGFEVPWWAYPTIGVGAVLTGMIVAGYIRTPVGAEATFCDLRWPLFGLTGIALATGSRDAGSTFAGLLVGPPGSLADLARLAVGVASVILLAWALNGRLGLERAVLTAAEDGKDALVCTTCRPLFPQRSPRETPPEAD